MQILLGCPVCEDNSASEVTARGHDFVGQKIQNCGNCGLYYQNPRPSPSELNDYYQVQYSKDYRAGGLPTEEAMKKRDLVARYRMQALQRADILQKGQHLLEIGCGAGNFLAACEQVGIQGHGIEPSESFANYGRTQGLNIDVGSFPQALSTTRKYDRVALFHVLEHLPTPMQSLAQFRDLLVDDGILIIEVPVLERALGWRWSEHYFHMPHLLDFCSDTLRFTLESSGFDIVFEDYCQNQARRKHHYLVAARRASQPQKFTFPNAQDQQTLRKRLNFWIKVSRYTVCSWRRLRRLLPKYRNQRARH